MVGSSKLFVPPSTTNIDNFGSASLSLEATMQAAVPPGIYQLVTNAASVKDDCYRISGLNLPPAIITSTSLI